MIFSIPATSFWLIMLCAFFAGILGTACSAVVLCLIRKKKKRAAQRTLVNRIVRAEPVSGWQRSAQDEQLYNSR